MKNLRLSSQLRRALPVLALPAALLAVAPAQVVQARPKAALLEAWPGQRVLFLLPVQLGPNFNVDPAFGTALLPTAAQNAQQILQGTDKFSVVEAHRFNPILQRALGERRITKDELDTLVNTPDLGNARAVFSKIAFDQGPMFAQFTIQEVRLGGTAKETSVQVQVTGVLSELTGEPYKNITVTSNPHKAARTSLATLEAANEAFAQIAAEFVRPIDEIQISLPVAETPVEPVLAADASPAAPASPSPIVINGITLPGDVPITGASSRGSSQNVPDRPAGNPPLDINVPDTPTAQ